MLPHYTTSWNDLHIRRSVRKTAGTLLGCSSITMDFCSLFLSRVPRLGGPRLFFPVTRPVNPLQSAEIIPLIFPHAHEFGSRVEDLDRSNFVGFDLGTLSMSVPYEHIAS